jgi:SAM-dependent methyltransferase
MRSQYNGITEVIRRHWDARAGTFDEGVGHGLVSDEQRRAWLDLLSRLVGEAPRRVLDVGCGTGFLALRLAELGDVVTGIDLSPRMIDRARGKADQEGRHIDFRVGDAAALEFPDETFDVVTARHVIWILPEPERGVAEWLRVLRPGGRLVLIEGRWGDDDSVRDYESRAPHVLGRAFDVGASFVLGHGGWFPRELVNRRYRRAEAQVPFSGGPPASRLAEFLEANSVHDVVVESLMDPILWSESPKFPRYLATGIRAPAPQLT